MHARLSCPTSPCVPDEGDNHPDERIARRMLVQAARRVLAYLMRETIILMSEAINRMLVQAARRVVAVGRRRGLHASSEGISGHQWSSTYRQDDVDCMLHQRSSVVISGHQRTGRTTPSSISPSSGWPLLACNRRCGLDCMRACGLVHADLPNEAARTP